MEQCIHWEAMCPDYWSPVGQVSKSCFVLGKKNSKTKCVSLFPMSVNTSGHIDGDHGAWSNAGETITEAARNIHARSFGGAKVILKFLFMVHGFGCFVFFFLISLMKK